MRKRLSADNRRFENGSADRLRSHPLLVLTRTVSVEIVYSLDQIPPSLKGGVLSIGNFDGVHRGHAQILGRLQDHAAKLGGPAIVLTFDPHPLALFTAGCATGPDDGSSKTRIISRAGDRRNVRVSY